MNPWMLLGIAVVWGLSLLGVGKWQRADGRTAERVVWQEREVKRANASAKLIGALQSEARAEEALRNEQMNVIATNYGKGYEDAEVRRRRDVAAARDGTLVLRLPASACSGSGSGSVASPRSAAGLGNGSAPLELPGATGGGVLPPAITADLYALADDADQVAGQLRACQQIILNDRKDPK